MVCQEFASTTTRTLDHRKRNPPRRSAETASMDVGVRPDFDDVEHDTRMVLDDELQHGKEQIGFVEQAVPIWP